MKRKSILVTGGAGYIGSHAVKELHKIGKYDLVVLDNLIYGHRNAVADDINFVHANVGDALALEAIFNSAEVEAVMHFAAYSYVGESVSEPLKYYDNNLGQTLNLLRAMRKFDCNKFVLSSTCAVYGDPEYVPLDEKHATSPVNPYGMSKLMLEKILADCNKAWGLRSVNLRYFNASGCSEDASIGECHVNETHLIPLVLYAVLGWIPNITVFGDDYETDDGTCIRDYIHVNDLAQAHVSAIEFLQNNPTGENEVINLGTGMGYSVKEIINVAEKVCGKKVPCKTGKRRAGDPAKLVADFKKAKDLLNWQARTSDIENIISTAWNWYNSNNFHNFSKNKFKSSHS